MALAAALTGTDRGEMLVGTEYRDSIRARGGDDVVHIRRGPDRIYGGSLATTAFMGAGETM